MGPEPPQQDIVQTPDTLREITQIYHEIYAPGLTAFLETQWFKFKDNNNADSFPPNQLLRDQFLAFLESLKRPSDTEQMGNTGLLETRIVWHLACVALTIPVGMNAGLSVLPADNDPTEARNRLWVVKHLLEGDILETNPLAAPVPDVDFHRQREFEFWYNLAEFVRLRDESRRNEILEHLRDLLDGRENRDVLYSVAVARQLAPHFPPGYQNSLPEHLEEDQPVNKLAVAAKFLQDEARVSGGTTNVVRRFSEIAARAFVNPGHNIASNTVAPKP